MCGLRGCLIKREEFDMVISGALQNVTAFPVIRRTADEDNSEGDSLMEGGVVEEREDSPGNQCYIGVRCVRWGQTDR